MANLDDTTTGYNWEKEGVYQIEKNDPVEGGADGISNRQAKQLAVRTRDLHTRLSALKTEAADLAAELTQLTAEVDVKVGEAKTYTEQQVQGAKSYTDDREVLIRKDLESGDAGTLTSAKGYTDAREELIRSALESGDAATLSDAETYADGLLSGLVDSAPAGLDTLKKLASAIGNNATFSTWVTNQLATKQANIPIVYIDDFETLNPSSSLTDSISGKTFTLRQGESCQFYSPYNANGKPFMGTSPTSNNSLGSISYWAGTITRIFSSYYMLTAYGSNTTTRCPQVATRIYYSSYRYEWVISTDFSSRNTSGYTKLPSGIMVQWGRLGRINTGVQYSTVTFPIAFSDTPYFVSGCLSLNRDLTAVEVLQFDTLTASQMIVGRRAARDGSTGYSGQSVLWIAIGSWK